MLFIHLFINGHLNAFRIFTTVNNAVMNIEVSVSFNVLLSCPSDILRRSGTAVSYGSFIFDFFQELPYYFLWWPRQFRCPPKSWQGFPFQKYLSFDDNKFNSYEMMSDCDFDLYFSLIILCTFPYTCGPLRCHLWKNVYSAHFLIWIFF